MAFEQRDMSGQLFHEDRKGSDRAPSYKGVAMIEGKSYLISCWVKPTKNGGKWLSLAFEVEGTRKGDKQPSAPAKREDDEFPF